MIVVRVGNMWGPSHFHRMISDMLSINICYSLECIETTESVYIKKRIQLSQGLFGTPMWPAFTGSCFGKPIWPP